LGCEDLGGFIVGRDVSLVFSLSSSVWREGRVSLLSFVVAKSSPRCTASSFSSGKSDVCSWGVGLARSGVKASASQTPLLATTGVHILLIWALRFH